MPVKNKMIINDGSGAINKSIGSSAKAVSKTASNVKSAVSSIAKGIASVAKEVDKKDIAVEEGYDDGTKNNSIWDDIKAFFNGEYTASDGTQINPYNGLAVDTKGSDYGAYILEAPSVLKQSAKATSDALNTVLSGNKVDKDKINKETTKAYNDLHTTVKSNLEKNDLKSAINAVNSYVINSSGSSNGGNFSSASGSADIDSIDPYQAYFDFIRQENDRQNAWSAEQAQKQMDFQERMSNTAHQREVDDLIAAGLNPVLSASGSGAPVGNGASAGASSGYISALSSVMMYALDAMSTTAVGVANAGKTNDGVFGSDLVKTLLKEAGKEGIKYAIKSIF